MQLLSSASCHCSSSTATSAGNPFSCHLILVIGNLVWPHFSYLWIDEPFLYRRKMTNSSKIPETFQKCNVKAATFWAQVLKQLEIKATYNRWCPKPNVCDVFLAPIIASTAFNQRKHSLWDPHFKSRRRHPMGHRFGHHLCLYDNGCHLVSRIETRSKLRHILVINSLCTVSFLTTTAAEGLKVYCSRTD